MAPSAPWTEQERDKLADLLGDVPFPVVVANYRRWASEHGLPVRTERAIKHAAYKLGMSLRPTGQWLTTVAIAEMLGKNQSKIRKWASNGWLRRQGKFVCRADLAPLARARPWLFGGCDRSGLMQLLERADLVDSILESYPRPRGRPIPVLCVTTGRRYPSADAAARACYVNHNTVIKSAREGRALLGLQFVFAS